MEKQIKKIAAALFEANLSSSNGFTALKEAERQFKIGQQRLEDATRMSHELFSKLGLSIPMLDEQPKDPSSGENGSFEFELDGQPDYINRLALRASIQLAERTQSFAEMCQIVRQDYVMPARGKLRVWVLADKVEEHASDPDKRYFTRYPITTKDGKVIYCTTQWAAKQLDKEKGEYVDGTFKRFIEEVAKAGIYIREIPKAA